MLITLLMEQLFIVREKGEIAMMKSIGFRGTTIALWQLIRMVVIVVIAMMFAIPLSMISNKIMVEPVFAIMGAEVAVQVDIVKAYILYLGILLLFIIAATLIACLRVRKIHIQAINNIE